MTMLNDPLLEDLLPQLSNEQLYTFSKKLSRLQDIIIRDKFLFSRLCTIDIEECNQILEKSYYFLSLFEDNIDQSSIISIDKYFELTRDTRMQLINNFFNLKKLHKSKIETNKLLKLSAESRQLFFENADNLENILYQFNLRFEQLASLTVEELENFFKDPTSNDAQQILYSLREMKVAPSANNQKLQSPPSLAPHSSFVHSLPQTPISLRQEDTKPEPKKGRFFLAAIYKQDQTQLAIVQNLKTKDCGVYV